MSSANRRSARETPRLQFDLIVLGASFAGVETLYQLWRAYDGKIRTAVVDRQRRHGYIPLVHERLCSRLTEPEATLETAAYLESLPHTQFFEDEIVSFDPETKTVALASGKTLSATMIVVALGSVLAPPPGIAGAERLDTLKFGAEFETARARLQGALSHVEASPSVVVIGGGISGAELAGELAHLAKRAPSGWRAPKVTLISQGPRLLENLSPAVARTAQRILEAQGVTVRLSTTLQAVEDGVVRAEGAEGPLKIAAVQAFWCGGVRPAPMLSSLGLPRTEEGWLSVGPTLQCFAGVEGGEPSIFACGDAVRVVGGDGQWPTMQRAIECLWQAKVVAKNLVRLAKHKRRDAEPPPMHPHTLRESFPYGVSLGAKSLLVVGAARLHVPSVTPWFRRFLMRQYFDRYTPLQGP